MNLNLWVHSNTSSSSIELELHVGTVASLFSNRMQLPSPEQKGRIEGYSICCGSVRNPCYNLVPTILSTAEFITDRDDEALYEPFHLCFLWETEATGAYVAVLTIPASRVNWSSGTVLTVIIELSELPIEHKFEVILPPSPSIPVPVFKCALGVQLVPNCQNALQSLPCLKSKMSYLWPNCFYCAVIIQNAFWPPLGIWSGVSRMRGSTIPSTQACGAEASVWLPDDTRLQVRLATAIRTLHQVCTVISLVISFVFT